MDLNSLLIELKIGKSEKTDIESLLINILGQKNKVININTCRFNLNNNYQKRVYSQYCDKIMEAGGFEDKSEKSSNDTERRMYLQKAFITYGEALNVISNIYDLENDRLKD
ncbi:Uncharacterised protein [Candidatus Tiddalikarchaeum anstoanum]|nr:Uncharacterised protein [Candidatus Tiddalikarchaeum anstoanum]